MERLDGTVEQEGSSLLEKVYYRTGDPKIAATMALDLLLVGIDTVSLNLNKTLSSPCVLADGSLSSSNFGARSCTL